MMPEILLTFSFTFSSLKIKLIFLSHFLRIMNFFPPYKYGREKEGVTLYSDLKAIFVDLKYFARQT